MSNELAKQISAPLSLIGFLLIIWDEESAVSDGRPVT